MILLFGGTSETARIADGLAQAGFRVLVSCATEIALNIGSHANIRRRTGPLNANGLTALIDAEKILLVVDATHPYAVQARATARQAAQLSGIPYITYIRPEEHAQGQVFIWAGDHDEAARIAFSMGKPVLITTGARNIAPYTAQARKTGIPLYARVLPETTSISACHDEGIPDEHIITGRGPFTVTQNREIIRKFAIGVIVTKESGTVGGFAEKIEAAHLEHCAAVVVRRPIMAGYGAFGDIEELLKCVKHFSSSQVKQDKTG
jgi:precorrin-6A/cobalt-precorrin-6A reductase